MSDETKSEKLGKFGHHPDETIDAEVEVERLTGLLCDARIAIVRGLDFNAASTNGLAIKSVLREMRARIETECPAACPDGEVLRTG